MKIVETTEAEFDDTLTFEEVTGFTELQYAQMQLAAAEERIRRELEGGEHDCSRCEMYRPVTGACPNCGDRGPWVQTASGAPFWPFDPRPEEFVFADTIWAASKLVRYLGHTRNDAVGLNSHDYSVLDHSLLVARFAVREAHEAGVSDETTLCSIALGGASHDFAEVLGFADVPSPVGRHHAMRWWRAAKRNCEHAVSMALGLAPGAAWWEFVYKADLRMLATEKASLLAPAQREWDKLPEPYNIIVEPRSAGAVRYEARRLFAAGGRSML